MTDVRKFVFGFRLDDDYRRITAAGHTTFRSKIDLKRTLIHVICRILMCGSADITTERYQSFEDNSHNYFHFSVQKYVYINGQLIALFIIFFNISHIVIHI